MITEDESNLLRMEKGGTVADFQHKEKGLIARLERKGCVKVMRMIDGSQDFVRTDLGYDALVQFDDAKTAAEAPPTFQVKAKKFGGGLWSFINSNLVVGVAAAVIGAVVGFVLSKFL